MIEKPTQLINDVIVSDDYKIIFFNIKKVASTSIGSYMFKELNGKNFIANSEIFKEKNNWYEGFKDYYSFAFVRNPFDRLLSCYKNKIKNPNDLSKETGVGLIFDPYGSKFYKNMTFKQFLEAIISLNPEEYDRHFAPQYKFVCDEDENVVVDFVGKFEHLQRDIDFLINKKKLPKQKLIFFNKSNFNCNYDEETIELAKQVHGLTKDLEIFNYEY